MVLETITSLLQLFNQLCKLQTFNRLDRKLSHNLTTDTLLYLNEWLSSCEMSVICDNSLMHISKNWDLWRVLRQHLTC